MRAFLGRLAAVAAASIVVALSCGQALADHVRCGDLITQDTTLDSDLLDCPGDGLVIGADNITLNLNGHTIDGDGAPAWEDTGVVNGRYIGDLPAHDGVVIENGSVREFTFGVLLGGHGDAAHNAPSENVVRNVNASANVANGITLASNADHNLVAHNDVSANGPNDEGGGISLQSVGPGNRIYGNRSSANFWGIFLEDGAEGTRIERNIVRGNLYGVYLTDQNQPTLIRKNDVSSNDFVGISMSETVNTRIEKNVVLWNGEGGGISAGSENDLEPPAPTVIVGNTASHNAADGIFTYGALTTVTRNVASANADFGIEALPGVNDGGGNRAFGNGNPLQCLNIVCRTKATPGHLQGTKD